MNIDESVTSARGKSQPTAVDGRGGTGAAARGRPPPPRLTPLKAERIDNLAKLVDRYEKDYRRGHEALRRQDFDTAEHYLPPPSTVNQPGCLLARAAP